MSEIGGVRSWLAWIIGAIWILTSIAVLIAYHVHPESEARATLNVREISFSTDAKRLFGPTQDREIVVSGIASVEIQGDSIKVTKGKPTPETLNSVYLLGDRSSTCVFYNVRAGGLFLSTPSRVRLIWNGTKPLLPLGVETSTAASMTITSQPGKSGLTCTGVHNGHDQGIVTLNAAFSDGGGDSISIQTSEDSRVDLGPFSGNQIQAVQIPILSTVRFAHVDPHGSKEESVLLNASSPIDANQIVFSPTAKSVSLDADLFVMRPRGPFYIKSVSIANGIHLILEGTLLEAEKGPGENALNSIMPTLLDHLLNEKGVLALIPSLVALIVGILEKMEVIPK